MADILHRTFRALLLLFLVKNGKCVTEASREVKLKRKDENRIEEIEDICTLNEPDIPIGRTASQHRDAWTTVLALPMGWLPRRTPRCLWPLDREVIRLGWASWASTWHSAPLTQTLSQGSSFTFKTETLRPRKGEWIVQGHEQSGHFGEVTPVNRRSSDSKISCLWDMPFPCHHQCLRQNEVVTCQGCCEENSCKRVQWPVSFYNFRFRDPSSSFFGLVRQYSSPSSLWKWISESILLHLLFKIAVSFVFQRFHSVPCASFIQNISSPANSPQF